MAIWQLNLFMVFTVKSNAIFNEIAMHTHKLFNLSVCLFVFFLVRPVAHNFQHFVLFTATQQYVILLFIFPSSFFLLCSFIYSANPFRCLWMDVGHSIFSLYFIFHTCTLTHNIGIKKIWWGLSNIHTAVHISV